MLCGYSFFPLIFVYLSLLNLRTIKIDLHRHITIERLLISIRLVYWYKDNLMIYGYGYFGFGEWVSDKITCSQHMLIINTWFNKYGSRCMDNYKCNKYEANLAF